MIKIEGKGILFFLANKTEEFFLREEVAENIIEALL